REPPLDRKNRFRAAHPCTVVSTCLRRGGALREALDLVELVNRSLQELAQAEPAAPHVFEELSHSWHHIGKARWELGQAEGTVDALERALEAQRQACTLAPAVAECRHLLGWRYVQLARKLCELGRLPEAEARFRERQALWPGDASKHAEALGELRKWAA